MANHYTRDEELLARFSKAMGHPSRIAIMRFLAVQRNCFTGEIQNFIPIAKAKVAQHLAELKESELIQGDIESENKCYCINKSNWDLARHLFEQFLGGYRPHENANCNSN